MAKKKREPVEPLPPSALRFWDPGRYIPRRLRLKIAKRDRRRGGTLRDVLRIELATIRVLDFIDDVTSATEKDPTEIVDPAKLLAGAR